MKFVPRNFDRTEKDDWTLHVQPRLCEHMETVEVFDEFSHSLVGWKIQYRYE